MSGDHVAWKQRGLSYESFDQESLCVPIVRNPGVDQDEIKWAKSLSSADAQSFFFSGGEDLLNDITATLHSPRTVYHKCSATPWRREGQSHVNESLQKQ